MLRVQRHWTVRPFTLELKQLSQYVYEYVKQMYLNENSKIMRVMNFNSVTILLYYGKSGKRVRQLSYHRDQQWKRNGTLDPEQNSQTPYTPTCVLTIGHPRVLNFILSDGVSANESSQIEFEPLSLCHRSLFILHPYDEIPRIRRKYAKHFMNHTYFKHGGIKHGPRDGLSVGFVFRTVDKQVKIQSNGVIECKYDSPDLDELDDMLHDFTQGKMQESEVILASEYENMKRSYTKPM